MQIESVAQPHRLASEQHLVTPAHSERGLLHQFSDWDRKSRDHLAHERTARVRRAGVDES